MINIENPIEEIKAIAAQSGVCCANCRHSDYARDDYRNRYVCNLIENDEIVWLASDFCSDFEPKPTDEK